MTFPVFRVESQTLASCKSDSVPFSLETGFLSVLIKFGDISFTVDVTQMATLKPGVEIFTSLRSP